MPREVDNEGNKRPGKRTRSNSMAGRSTRSMRRAAHSTGPIPSLTEADIPCIDDAIIQAMSMRSRENPHGDSNLDSTDTENDTDDFTPSDTIESGKMYYNQ